MAEYATDEVIATLRSHPEWDDVFVDSQGRLWRDTSNGYSRTFPVVEKRRAGYLLDLSDAGETPIARTEELIDLHRALVIQMQREGLDPAGRHKKKPIVSIIKKIQGGRQGHWTTLKNMWRCGLVKRYGWVGDYDGARPRDNQWVIQPPSA